MTFRLARVDELEHLATLAREAQAWLRARGLGQYVPAAHAEYADSIRARVESGTLYALELDGAALAFFSLDDAPSEWWPADGANALHLAGMVVARAAHHRGLGGRILAFAHAEARRRGRTSVRLDCHADNRWLCAYYESNGFALRGRIEQQPGYVGCLYEAPLG